MRSIRAMRPIIKLIILLLAVAAAISSCRKERLTLDPNNNIQLSADTLYFDTVFTKASSSRPLSVNKQILIYNPYEESIRTSVTLAGGTQSHFRLNVDGEAGHQFSDIEIFPNDSIFIFVEVHPDPNNNNPEFNPLIIRDSLLFNTNGNESKTMLIGWGQDAHYIFRDSIETDTTWANDQLPIVVYGYCYVKPDVTLTIAKNMNIHFAPNSWLYVEGKVNIQGTKEEPVLMQGDRLQPAWEETPGQWGGVWISYPSSGSEIEHALIKNGTVGVYCDTVSGNPNIPSVTLRKTMIRNMQVDGIHGQGATIYAENCISTNCGRYSFLASEGGDYTLLHNTFYTGTKDFIRQNPTFAFTNVTRDPITRAVLDEFSIKYTFINNIIDGPLADGEIVGDLSEDISLIDGESLIDYNAIQTEDQGYFSTASSNLQLLLQDTMYIDAFNFNLDLDSLSPARGQAVQLVSPLPTILDDFCNRPRNTSLDIGAYQSQY